MNDVLKGMLERLRQKQAEVAEDIENLSTALTEDDNPPVDEFTENIAYHWRRHEKASRAKAPEKPALKPEAAVLRALKAWLKRVPNMDVKRVSVGKMRTKAGFMMNFGGKVGESDLILTPHKGQPFERQIHVEAKRPDVIVDGKKVQRAGKQSDNQVKYQQEMEARGDAYVVVTSVAELHDFLESLGFTGLPRVPKGR